MDHNYKLKTAIVAKKIELDASIESGKPLAEVMELYRQLKELNYQLIQAELDMQERVKTPPDQEPEMTS